MFAELLARSCFSFLRGASQPEELVLRAKELGYCAIGLCDRDGLYGSVRAFTQARQCGQRVIVGAELTLADSSRFVDRASRKAARCGPGGGLLALLVENHRGYENLCRLLTRSHADHPKGESALDIEWLGEHSEGLTAVVPVPRDPGDGDAPPLALFSTLRDVFGARAYLALYRRLDGYDRERTQAIDNWSRRFGLPIVASCRPLFHHPNRKPLADVMHCIREGTTLDRVGTAIEGNAEAYLRSESELHRLFSDCPDCVDRAGEVAETLNFSLDELRYAFPCELLPGESADEKLRRLTSQGLLRRYPGGVPSSVSAQIEKELSLIAKLEMAPYFLSTWEIVEIARRRRILCQGRGSAANSAVCYALGITAVDPARSNLLFERFMSAERHEPPDIDIDFEHERREEVIQEIYERYGRDRAAMVSEVICYRGKSALREVGKTFGLSLEQVDTLSSTIIHWDSAEMSNERLAELGFDPADKRLRQTVMLARQLEGMPRHLSIHVGGFVLSARPLYDVAPVEPARMADRTVVPWDKDDLETLGFFKVDVLGLGMLTAIRKALALIHLDGELQREGSENEPNEPEPFDPLDVVTRIPPEDPAVYEMICRADTVGVFQIESRAQMAMLPRLRPIKYYDLVIEVAIVRPGPIQGGMVHPYLRRRRGEELVGVPHPDLWPILERTLGVPLFQEQVMQISIVGAGYSGGQADQLRRDMAAWKKSGRLLSHRQRLLDGFAQKGIPAEFGEALFEQIKGFGDYGFPESHAASFALLVYTSAWQKVRYPAHFACALLNAQPMGFYSPSSIIQDAQRHGVEVRDVSVVHSDWDCTLEEQDGEFTGRRKEGKGGGDQSKRSFSARRALRLGLREIKGLGEKWGERLVEVRRERPFTDLEDLIRRTTPQKDEIDALAEAGALEDLTAGRRQALWQVRAPRVGGLFAPVNPREPEVVLPALRPVEQLLLDYERKGLSVDDHPMRHLRTELRARGVITATELIQAPKGARVRVAGLVTCRQQPGTASGVVFVTLEDETGTVNLVLWRRVFDRFHHVARHSTVLYAVGEVEREVKEPVKRAAHFKKARPRRPDDSTSRELPFAATMPRVELPVLPPESAPVIHVIVDHLERLDVPGRSLRKLSRDFH